LLAWLGPVSPPGLTRRGSPLTRTPRLSFHAFGLHMIGCNDSYVPHPCMHCMPTSLDTSAHASLDFVFLRLRSADDLPQFHRPAAACLHLTKSSSTSAPNQLLQCLSSRLVRIQSIWDQVPTLFASATQSQPHPAHKQTSKFHYFLNPVYPNHIWLNFGVNRCPPVFMWSPHRHENIMARILS
jgi:hypothetical protein